jgi:hypothetical protein
MYPIWVSGVGSHSHRWSLVAVFRGDSLETCLSSTVQSLSPNGFILSPWYYCSPGVQCFEVVFAHFIVHFEIHIYVLI